MVDRETQPGRWAAKEQRRLERRRQQVETLLEKERTEHARKCECHKCNNTYFGTFALNDQPAALLRVLDTARQE